MSDLSGSELLPCPFCGDRANIEHWGSEVSILCSNCNVRSAPFFAENEAQAIAAWNTRTTPPIDQQEVERDNLFWQIGGIIADMRTWDGLPINQHVDGAEIQKAAGRIRALSANSRAITELTHEVERLRKAASNARAWVFECWGWLMETDLDLKCPMEVDPLDIVEQIDAILGIDAAVSKQEGRL